MTTLEIIGVAAAVIVCCALAAGGGLLLVCLPFIAIGKVFDGYRRVR